MHPCKSHGIKVLMRRSHPLVATYSEDSLAPYKHYQKAINATKLYKAYIASRKTGIHNYSLHLGTIVGQMPRW
jgi:hypothetical protein